MVQMAEATLSSPVQTPQQVGVWAPMFSFCCHYPGRPLWRFLVGNCPFEIFVAFQVLEGLLGRLTGLEEKTLQLPWLEMKGKNSRTKMDLPQNKTAWFAHSSTSVYCVYIYIYIIYLWWYMMCVCVRCFSLYVEAWWRASMRQYPDGSTFTGCLRNGLRHGPGVVVSAGLGISGSFALLYRKMLTGVQKPHWDLRGRMALPATFIMETRCS